MFEYSEKVIEHFRHPRNQKRIKNPDGVGKVGNPVCGDVMYLYIKVGKKNGEEYIKDIGFETMGCVAAVSTSSMLTELVKGKTLKEAEKIDKKDIAEALNGLPKIKMHCSVLAIKALKEAIKDYKRRKK